MPSGKRKPALVALSHLRLDKTSDLSLRRSLYLRVRDAIAEGAIKAGTRLPSTRQLAAELKISRNTVSDAFAQLTADGLVVARHGSGTFVGATDVRVATAVRPPTAWERASTRGKLLAARPSDDDLYGRASLPFQPGIPAFEHFPFETWARIASRILRRPTPNLLGYGNSAGYGPLREAIAAEIRARGGPACRDEQIVIVGGTTQALDLICRLTLDAGDEVWIEDPSSLYVRATLSGAGAQLVPVPVDDDGIDVGAGIERAPHARLAHVTSAHQWPLGSTLSEARRQQLLAWAQAADAWIVEDEYDGVFRYDGKQPRSLRALDGSDRVIAIGSFSVTTFPAIRLGYIVAPPALVDAFAAAKATADRQASLLEQAILADFIYDGHFAKYRKMMETVYAGRQSALIDRIAALGGPPVARAASGLHVVLPLGCGIDDGAVSRAARDAGVLAPPLSRHYLGEGARKGLVLGFGAGSVAAIDMAAVKLVRDVLRAPRSGPDKLRESGSYERVAARAMVGACSSTISLCTSAASSVATPTRRSVSSRMHSITAPDASRACALSGAPIPRS